MENFKLDTAKILQFLDQSIAVGTTLLLQKSKEKVPRNWENPPKALDFKGKFYATPKRNVRKWNKKYYLPVTSDNGKFYAGVTGELKNSLTMEKISNGNYIIGIEKWPTEVYAWTQEFGDPSRNIPARSFLRKPMEEEQKNIENQIIQIFSELLQNG